jgi:hypothetical protein
MALKVFGTKPTSGQSRDSIDIVGSLRSGKSEGGQPMALPTWAFSTGDPEVVDALSELFGSVEVEERDTKGEETNLVITGQDAIRVILQGERGLRLRWVLRDSGFRPVYISDGETITNMDDQSTEPDPDAHLTLDDRLDKAKRKRGPALEIELLFRLADAPELGYFRFQNSGASFVKDLANDAIDGEYEDMLADNDGGPILASLGKKEVTTKAGRTFTKVSMRLLGPAK